MSPWAGPLVLSPVKAEGDRGRCCWGVWWPQALRRLQPRPLKSRGVTSYPCLHSPVSITPTSAGPSSGGLVHAGQGGGSFPPLLCCGERGAVLAGLTAQGTHGGGLAEPVLLGSGRAQPRWCSRASGVRTALCSEAGSARRPRGRWASGTGRLAHALGSRAARATGPWCRVLAAQLCRQSPPRPRGSRGCPPLPAGSTVLKKHN